MVEAKVNEYSDYDSQFKLKQKTAELEQRVLHMLTNKQKLEFKENGIIFADI